MISIMLKANGGFRGNLVRVYFVKMLVNEESVGISLTVF